MSSAAFLDSSISELFIEAKDENAAQSLGLDSSAVAQPVSLADIVERASVLHKYQVARTAAGKKSFDEGGPYYQDAVGLIKLRNALVHYKPEWDDEPDVHNALEKRLMGKFEHNHLRNPGAFGFLIDALALDALSGARTPPSNLVKNFVIVSPSPRDIDS